jgi:hypothetical protein
MSDQDIKCDSTQESAEEPFDLHCSDVLDQLFLKAKSQDEFEYVCALLRIRGMEDAGWDPLSETDRLFRDMLGLIHAPLEQHTRIRLALLTYSHLTEVDAIYSILKNMLLVIEGKRCSIEPFWELFRSSKKGVEKSRMTGVIPPSAKSVINNIVDHAKTLNENPLAEILLKMFNEQIRNAFFHSDYILFRDEFRSREARFGAIKLEKLVEQVNLGLGFYQSFIATFTKHIQSYDSPKKVTGRILGDETTRVELTLLADKERGLYGFQGSSAGIVKDPATTVENEIKTANA